MPPHSKRPLKDYRDSLENVARESGLKGDEQMIRFRLLRDGSLQVETAEGWITIRRFDMDAAGREADAHKLCKALKAVGTFADGMD
jgi:hypothetical protein